MFKIQNALMVVALVGGYGLGCKHVKPQMPVSQLDLEQEVNANILVEEPTPMFTSGAIFDGKIELIGYEFSEPLEVGKPVTWTWYWRALADGTENLEASIELVSEDKSYLHRFRHVPANPPSRWKKGQIIRSVQTVTLDWHFPGGEAVVWLGLYKGEELIKVSHRPDSAANLPGATGDVVAWCSGCDATTLGVLGGTVNVIGDSVSRHVRASILVKEEPTPMYKSGAIFDGKIELIGFDITDESRRVFGGPLAPGMHVTFTWYWRALSDGAEDWKMYAHLDSVRKEFRQRLDHAPTKDYPTSRWKKGQIIRDVQKAQLAWEFPLGDVSLDVGLYNDDAQMRVTNIEKAQELSLKVAGQEILKPKYEALMVSADAVAAHVIDGKLDEDVWTTLPELTLGPFRTGPDLSSVIKTFVSPTHLYVGAVLHDTDIRTTLTERDYLTSEDDFMMILDLNGDGKDYLVLQLTPNNVVADARFETRIRVNRQAEEAKARAFDLPNLKSAVHVDTDKSWTVEFSIPLSEIPGFTGVKAGDVWALNFFRSNLSESDELVWNAWSTAVFSDFHEVHKFGELHIVDTL